MLLLAYELIKMETVDRVRAAFEAEGRGEEYAREFPKKPHPRLKRTCEWLVANGAFDEASARDIITLAEHRHAVAHEILRFILDPSVDIDTKLLRAAFPYLTSLSQFWQAREIDPSKAPYRVFKEVGHLPSFEALVMRYILQVASAGTSDQDSA